MDPATPAQTTQASATHPSGWSASAPACVADAKDTTAATTRLPFGNPQPPPSSSAALHRNARPQSRVKRATASLQPQPESPSDPPQPVPETAAHADERRD